MLRPHIRIPLWAAVAIPAAAYLIRGYVRGSLRPDLPEDVVVLGALLLVLLLASRYGTAAQRRRDELAGEVQDRYRAEDRHRQDDQV